VSAFSHNPPPLRWLSPGRMEVTEPFTFMSPTLGPVVVEKGFDTDGASVPRAFWAIYPADGGYLPGALVHDMLYWHQAACEGGIPITRAQSDTVFLEAMTALGIPWARRRLLYSAVRAFGWKAWADNAKKKASEAAVSKSP
jgi:hypothetical protein